MKITGFEILTIEIPMQMAVQHALAERQFAQNILVMAKDETGLMGWGESCPRTYVTGETLDSVKQELMNQILPLLLGREFMSMDEVVHELTNILDSLRRDQQAAFCAAELAALDLAGRCYGVSAGSVLGPVLTQQVYYSGVIASENPAGVENYAGLMRKFGVKDVKVKVGKDLEKNLDILNTARTVLGEEVTLRLDANCAWTAAEAIRQLKAMKGFQLVGVEQPVAGDDVEGMRVVTAAGLVPVVADESLASIEDATTLIRAKACNIFNIRISKCGGLINAGRLHRLAEQAGLSCQLGAQVGETGFLSAAGRHFGTRCRDVIWLEGSYGSLLLEQDITTPDVTVGPAGMAVALNSPGLGVEPQWERIDKYTTKILRVE